MNAPPPGWYPDPESTQHLRYWDGVSWTSEVVLAEQGRVRLDATPDGVPTAAPWFRMLAEVIDAAILLPVILLAGWPFLARISRDHWADLADRVGNAAKLGENGSSASATLPLLGFLLVALVLAVGYRVLLWQWRSASLGQQAMGLSVRRWESAEPLDVRTSLVRSLAQLGFLPFLAVPVVGLLVLLWPVVDALWVFGDERRQTLHDRAAGSCVVGGPEELEDDGVDLFDDGDAPERDL
jgi:uncharacterized RDD family membrane protein YckC